MIFASQRIDNADADYQVASAAMETLAKEQPGYTGMVSARGDDGFGITVSYWRDEASAVRWRDHSEHTAIRERGRGVWYDSYTVDVADISRNYAWNRHD